MISEIEQQSFDFDWFFTDGTNIEFAASGGGKLPLTISVSRLDFDIVSTYFNTRTRICDAVINPK
ncbi:hypothetical protein [Mucilaginibacter glaciei]|uniref:Uncharacterized protein n=1 Tax=Mucilaginibacter glaciei TaxID=2772109 RepID=A0A926NMQ9_9SPHI|nr:hypothetical protein [Mucilaginibacter glaciei]MBD1394934.1 hypothetical protein [Mucilaginibacter glaciei]